MLPTLPVILSDLRNSCKNKIYFDFIIQISAQVKFLLINAKIANELLFLLFNLAKTNGIMKQESEENSLLWVTFQFQENYKDKYSKWKICFVLGSFCLESIMSQSILSAFSISITFIICRLWNSK